MNTIIIIVAMLMVACGMPGMPDRIPASERPLQLSSHVDSEPAESQTVSGGAAAVSSSAPPSANSSTSGGGEASVSSTKPSTLVKSSALPVVINEILYDLPGDDTNGDLFVELRGSPGGDLGGYKLSFINGDDGKETENVTIPPGLNVPNDGLFVIADGITGDLQHTHVANADYLDNFDPQNGPDSVQLLSPEGKLIDALSYGAPKLTTAANGLAMLEGLAAKDAPMNQSISRLADAEDTNDNGADFVVNNSPSPGSYDVAVAP